MKKPEKPTETLKGAGTRQTHLYLRSASKTGKHRHPLGRGRLQQSPLPPSAQDAIAASLEPDQRASRRPQKKTRFFNPLVGINLGAIKETKAGCGCNAFGTPCGCLSLFQQRDGRKIKRTLIKTQEQSQTGLVTIVMATRSEAEVWEDAGG